MRIVSLVPSATEIVLCARPRRRAGRAARTSATIRLRRPTSRLSPPRCGRRERPRAADRTQRVAASVHGGESIYELDLSALARRRPGPGPDPASCAACARSAIDEVAEALARSAATRRSVSLEPDERRGHLQRDLNRGRNGRGGGRGGRPRSSCCASGWRRIENRVLERRLCRPRAATGGLPRVARSTLRGRPLGARAGPPRRRLGTARHGRRTVSARRLGTTCATSSRR